MQLICSKLVLVMHANNCAYERALIINIGFVLCFSVWRLLVSSTISTTNKSQFFQQEKAIYIKHSILANVVCCDLQFSVVAVAHNERASIRFSVLQKCSLLCRL